MGFPAGMQLATAAFGIPLTATGKDIVTTVTVKPTARVIWAATGQPLPEFSDSFTAEAGQLGTFQVPFIDQAGFIDSTGATFTDWAYQITAEWRFGNERPITWSKNFKPLVAQTGTIDLDLVPDGAVSIPVTAPTAAVLGFHGRTGFITIQESDLPQRLSVADLSATILDETAAPIAAAVAPKMDSAVVRSTALGGGRFWVFAGDSITNGSSSTNTSVDSYRVMVGKVVGTHKVRQSSINAGVPGDNSTQLLARTDAIIAQAPESAFVLIGTNDANQSVPLATFQTNVLAIAAKFRAAGIPLAFGTVPPRVSGVAAGIHTLIGQYNLWLSLWAPRNGVKLADVHTSLTDPVTGYAAAALMDADGIHPNDAGHLAMSKVIAVVADEMVLSEPWPVNGPQPGVGMIANPLMAGSGTATSWAINAGIGSGIAGVQGLADPVPGDNLPYGKWSTFRMDGTTTAGSRYLLTAATGFAVGDRLLICAYLKSSDASATGLTMNVLNSSTGAAVVSAPVLVLKTGSPGPIMAPITIPDPAPAAGSLRIGIGQVVGIGQDITAYIGAVQVYNLTALGLANVA